MGDLKQVLLSTTEKDYANFSEEIGELVEDKMKEKLAMAIEQTEETIFENGNPSDSVLKTGKKVTRPDKPKGQPKGSLPKLDKKVDDVATKIAFNKKSEAEDEEDDESEDDEKKKKFNFDKKDEGEDNEDDDESEDDENGEKKKKFNFDKKKGDSDDDDSDKEDSEDKPKKKFNFDKKKGDSDDEEDKD